VTREEQDQPLPLRYLDEPFADQLEWLDNRYNPGYFLGGTIRPELRVASLGWHAKRLAGAFALFSAVPSLVVAAVLLVVARMLPDPWSLGLGLLYVLTCVRMWRAAACQTPSPERRGAGEGIRCVWMGATAVLGAVVAAAVGTAIVVGVAVVAAVARGQIALIAAVAVVIAIAAVRRAARSPTTGS